jgi:uncharacterized protein DUF6919
VSSIIENPAAAKAWRAAQSLRDLGRLTADWLQGRLAEHPTYGDSPDDETGTLIPTLVRANHAGLVTDSSQPGHGPVEGYDGKMWLQRAYVSGWVHDDDIDRFLDAYDGREDLILLTTVPGPAYPKPEIGRDYIAATLRENDTTAETGLYDVHTVAGLGPDRTYLKDMYRGTVGAGAYRQLRDAWYVTIAEVDYDDGGALWKALDEALGGGA